MINDAVALEKISKEAFDRDKVCYEHNCQQFRAMNQIMWQVPLLAITITGGLWYAALNGTGTQEFNRPLFLLAAVLNVALLFVLGRIRFVMAEYLKKIKDFNPSAFVEASGTGLFTRSYTVVIAFSLALLVAAFGSIIGFFNLNWLRI